MKHIECHGILMLGKSFIKWRQRPDMTIAVDWDVKHQFKQLKNKTKTKKQHISYMDVKAFCRTLVYCAGLIFLLRGW